MSAEDLTTALEIREIPGTVGYGVDREGNTWTRHKRGNPRVLLDTWHPLKQSRDSVGYWGVGIKYTDGTTQRTRTHTLVLLAFVGPPPGGCEALHDDGTRTNNRLENLRWGTHSENMKDAVRHGSHVRPLASGPRKLTVEQVRVIRKAREDGMTYRRIARQHGVSESCIAGVIRGLCWGYVDREEP